MPLFILSSGARLLRAIDRWKDQTLFLSQIPQKSLQRTMFPIGDLTKDVVKKIASASGFDKIVQKREVRSCSDFIFIYHLS